MPRPPVSDSTRLEICELASEGLPVREIARQLKLAPSTVTRHARQLGVKFDRAGTAAATMARENDAKAKRSEASLRAIDTALAELDKLYQPARIVGVVGGNNAGVHVRVVPRPPASDRLAIVRIFATLVDTHLKLADIYDDGAAHARSLLGRLQVSLDLAQTGDYGADEEAGADGE